MEPDDKSRESGQPATRQSDKIRRIIETEPHFVIAHGIGLVCIIFLILALIGLLLPLPFLSGLTLWEWAVRQ